MKFDNNKKFDLKSKKGTYIYYYLFHKSMLKIKIILLFQRFNDVLLKF